MTKRLSLADLKAKSAAAVIQNTELYMGGEESGCHQIQKPIDGCGGDPTRVPSRRGN
ncbi:MAG: hypothetical protein RLZZ628_2646 [Bacteroidota bacterium]|jgi:hypothetical protein